ncbi:hypothetical protein F4778DRAFT_203095 [Xylariomycetidae sp. FL2044]|nr:hypothetical protein F4778DRAFT_203095 [Xylariomycetidae sp. FL2044]
MPNDFSAMAIYSRIRVICLGLMIGTPGRFLLPAPSYTICSIGGRSSALVTVAAPSLVIFSRPNNTFSSLTSNMPALILLMTLAIEEYARLNPMPPDIQHYRHHQHQTVPSPSPDRTNEPLLPRNMPYNYSLRLRTLEPGGSSYLQPQNEQQEQGHHPSESQSSIALSAYDLESLPASWDTQTRSFFPRNSPRGDPAENTSEPLQD